MNPNDTFDPKRYGLITGSRCHVLFPKRSAEVGQTTYARELAQNMYFRFYDNQSTWQTEHGNLSESSAFEYYQQNFEHDAEYTPPFMCEGDYGGQADCITPIRGVDFKCPTTLSGWLSYLFDGISDQQYHQCQMYMEMYKRDNWRIAAYLLETDRMSNNGETYPVPYDKRMICIDVQREAGWCERLDKAAPFVIQKRDEFYEQLKQAFK
jgi:hypothetical protein